jgi:DNA sulfur modification protein DndD
MQEQFLQEMEDYRANLEFSKHFNMLVGKIDDYPDSLLVALSQIDKQYKDSEDELEKLQSQRKRYLEKKNELDGKIEEVKKKHGVDPRQQAGTANLLKNGLIVSRAELEKIKRRLTASEKIIAESTYELRDCEKELEKLRAKGGDAVTSVEETEWKNISVFLEDICSRVQEKARKDLLQMIEEKANVFYKKFTEHDNGYKGRIDIDEDYTIRFDAGLNTSHEDRKKMSIINALLSLNQEALGIYYPFISDAPTSSFDPETTHKYLMGIKDIFDQTIIITKDVEVGSKNYLDIQKASNVSHIYELQSKLYCDEGKEPEIYEVSTIVIDKNN